MGRRKKDSLRIVIYTDAWHIPPVRRKGQSGASGPTGEKAVRDSFDLTRIGLTLRKRREEKGLTLEETAAALCISKRTVGAIESGDWESLPHTVYVKGYVTDYASFLDIPVEALSELVHGEESSPERPEEASPLSARNRGIAGRVRRALRFFF
jgi:transcriptional regulator with XRE-family HTH domain